MLILHIFTPILLLLILFPLSLLAVELDSPASPDDVNSAMYTLEDLCNRLQDGTTVVKRGAHFVEPPAGPIDGVGCSLNKAMSLAPVVDTINGAKPDEVLSGKTFWGLGTGGYWGFQTGTLVVEPPTSVVETPIQELSDSTTIVKAGQYEATTLDAIEPDLVEDHIKSGITLFGVTGNPNVVDTLSGDATAADIALGKKAWVDGKEVTGTLEVTNCPPVE